MLEKLKKVKGALAVLVMSLFVASPAMAFTAPATGDFLYDGYDILFNKILFGPGGWIAAGMLLAYGVSQLVKSWMVTVMCLLGAALVIKLEAVLLTLGAAV